MRFNLDSVADLTELETLQGDDDLAYVINEWEAKLVADYLVHHKIDFYMEYFDEPRIPRRYDFKTVEGYVFS